MRVATYRRQDGTVSFGIVDGDDLYDTCDDFKRAYPDVKALLRADGLEMLKLAISSFQNCELSDVTLMPPLLNADKIICVGLNYRSHIAETGRELSKFPAVFTRHDSTLVGHGQPMIRPTASRMFDFEGELAVIIGTQGRRISRSDASRHVAGYACFNDGSLRDFQRHTSQFWAGKNFDQSGAFGPWLVTADEVPNIIEQKLLTRLNGQIVQSTSIGDLLFDIPALIEYLSVITELQPGDVIATGTPAGVGLFREPQLWMKPGDKIEIEISNVGLLSNVISDEIAQ